jgi:hypothetical protein
MVVLLHDRVTASTGREVFDDEVGHSGRAGGPGFGTPLISSHAVTPTPAILSLERIIHVVCREWHCAYDNV